MSTATEPSEPTFSKARVITASLADMAIDIVVPTLVYLLLAPTHLAIAIRLTLGGFLVAAKATSGRTGYTASEGDQARPAGRWARFALAAAGAVTACAVTIIAAAAGAGTTPSIVAGTLVITISSVLLLLADHRNLDGFAILILAELVVTVIVTLISSDPRFVLARPAVYTAVAGIYAFTTVRKKPFVMQITRPMAAGGDPVRAAAFDRAWHESARFRAAERAMTVGLGIVLLAESVLRVVLVYSQPEHAVLKASLLSQLPAIGLFILWFIVARFGIVPIASKEVDALMPPRDRPDRKQASGDTPAQSEPETCHG
jgi:hypothetical protein